MARTPRKTSHRRIDNAADDYSTEDVSTEIVTKIVTVFARCARYEYDLADD